MNWAKPSTLAGTQWPRRECTSTAGLRDLNTFFIEFLTRDRCPLCKEGEAVATRVARVLRCELIPVQVEADDDLLAEFAMRIPVIRDPGGEVLDEGRIEFGVLLVRTVVARWRWAVSQRR